MASGLRYADMPRACFLPFAAGGRGGVEIVEGFGGGCWNYGGDPLGSYGGEAIPVPHLREAPSVLPYRARRGAIQEEIGWDRSGTRQ